MRNILAGANDPKEARGKIELSNDWVNNDTLVVAKNSRRRECFQQKNDDTIITLLVEETNESHVRTISFFFFL